MVCPPPWLATYPTSHTHLPLPERPRGATSARASLCVRVGERWPLAVLHAKVDAMPEACEAELVEMLSPGSFWRGTGSFPFAAYILKEPLESEHRWGKEPVPAGTLLEKASPDALASLCAPS